METVYRDYRNKDVQFFYVYKNLAHPEVNNFVPVFSIEERVKHIEKATEMMKTEMNWICDTLNNDVKDKFGGTYNGEFIIDTEGKLIKKRFWSDPVSLRKDLVEIIGPVEKETKVADLETVFSPEPRKIANNVVPKPNFPRGLSALLVAPEKSEDPYFAKLRVEGDRNFVEGLEGAVFFTAYLDPLYKVHWNNRAGKVKIELMYDDDRYKFNKTSLESIDVKEDADVDPRWMLTRGKALKSKSFKVKMTYTICDDADTFCKTIEQVYKVTPFRDPAGGTRPGIFLNEMFANVKQMDTNGDKKLTKDELPKNQVTLYVGHLDYNGNEIIEFAEVDRFMSMFNNGRGVDSKNDGN